jgi:hypothetical protein
MTTAEPPVIQISDLPPNIRGKHELFGAALNREDAATARLFIGPILDFYVESYAEIPEEINIDYARLILLEEMGRTQ